MTSQKPLVSSHPSTALLASWVPQTPWSHLATAHSSAGYQRDPEVFEWGARGSVDLQGTGIYLGFLPLTVNSLGTWTFSETWFEHGIRGASDTRILDSSLRWSKPFRWSDRFWWKFWGQDLDSRNWTQSQHILFTEYLDSWSFISLIWLEAIPPWDCQIQGFLKQGHT